MNDCLGEEQDALIAAIANKHMGIDTSKEHRSEFANKILVYEIEAALKEALRTGINIGIKMTVTQLK